MEGGWGRGLILLCVCVCLFMLLTNVQFVLYGAVEQYISLSAVMTRSYKSGSAHTKRTEFAD